jgi:ATP-dependent DNA helicase DinG
MSLQCDAASLKGSSVESNAGANASRDDSDHADIDHADTACDVALLQQLQAANSRFQYRVPQWQIVQAVRDALAASNISAVFAAQSAGQSFALLLAALACQQRVVISVASVALQHKLRDVDWPQIQAAMSTSKRLAIISSRRNQLCPQRLQQQCNRRDGGELAPALMQWHLRSASRDLSLCPLVREDEPVIAKVSCSGTRCAAAHCMHEDHHTADIVVVTHAWLLSQKSLPKWITGSRLLVDDVHHWFGTALERAAQTLDIAFWMSQSSAFETWLGKHLPLEIETLRPYLRHMVAVAGALNRADNIEELLVGLRDAVNTFLQVFNHLVAVRGIRIVEQSTWLDYCRWYLQWHECYVRRDDARYSIVRQMVRNVPGWLCRIEGDGDIAAYVRPLQSFATAIFACGGRLPDLMLPAPLRQRLLATSPIAAVPLWETRLRVELLPVLTASMDESIRMQAVVEHLLERVQSATGRWLLLVTQRAQIDKFRALLPKDDERLLLQGEQPKTVLLKRFSAMSQGVLVATWQMIDGWDFGDAGIGGAILDRLPLAAGGVAAASLTRDRTAFVETALPQAQAVMERVAGMLIRREWQTATLVLADTRLLTHTYAETIIESLPALAPRL